MNDRIVKLRKDRGWTQDKFAEEMKISKNYVSLIENGKKYPSDRLISAICKEFGVREEWLRTGYGEMKQNDDRYAHNLAKLTNTTNETIIEWVNAIAETHPDTLKEIEVFFKKILGIDE